MLARHHDPIAAIATAPGRGAVGIVRVSGKGLGVLVEAVCGRTLRPREATYLPFRDAVGQPIDQGLALFFPAPHSYTGEDVLELQAHGGPVVLQLLLARCLEAGAQAHPATGQPALPGLRVAQPGEFTERAFLNDKIDLAQAEAIADLIDASTTAAARSASRSLTGAFSHEIHALRDALIHLRMLVEATLDFPEEEIDFLRKADARGQLSNLKQTLSQVMQRARQGALLREGIKVVIAGQPNAGKSSLLNALAGAELAIVTPIAGTTRDKVQQTIQIEGVPLHIIDTAGLRDSDDEVERIGIARAWDEIAGADAVLFLHDLARRDAMDYRAADAMIESTLAEKLPSSVPVIDVWNKVDCVPGAAQPASAGRAAVHLSARTGEGLDALRRILLEVAGWQSAPEGVYIARARHVQALRTVQQHLEEAAAQLDALGPALDLLAEELRLAQNALSSITGEFSSDDLLGVIFSSFCIGK
ncbi:MULTISPECIES: tRNA uridine-5-carboxymethylaminomethyl(34) synthesis GTPase MnmE [unclassified Acidovorax]|jgi:tRNA modification GTPase|uniref:tRNA uridine-5-carboxymethylaminomethyl(34) synthesis GTPase MnmE n=1 Tax=unclassified Acidovorax TaxID=2684926 RepID=UPI000BD55DAE|nr:MULTISPECIES: tRNA uridine-5-carboxymethylaminomethyl(34) synthesis GTPase MnmE [unclassified Acidovorax]OZA57381.1 MAG: tRNA uridine-5-carboxymethylaminomethyl(34) synthesis GTPase MnmE [Acidovorax sp. 17-64-282]HQS19848.1 tRNA uridine-5-carboxymethylaminomethyl(34) synthesis GTPase MnmE [Acidovorax defluvii]OYY29985.1 MAG: tRNA uridine-5-carboxymethylaminomethyl(34) synthesis GTPase MnmE [Acidovorax sp. 35-64-16]OYY86307.1 MAG: tRNA uridine-5-carboxymethylaminomethyl(34) synthesis GTPase M